MEYSFPKYYINETDEKFEITKTTINEFYLNNNQELCSWYIDGILQTNELEIRDMSSNIKKWISEI